MNLLRVNKLAWAKLQGETCYEEMIASAGVPHGTTSIQDQSFGQYRPNATKRKGASLKKRPID
jgi:hypothetical protein